MWWNIIMLLAIQFTLGAAFGGFVVWVYIKKGGT